MNLSALHIIYLSLLLSFFSSKGWAQYEGGSGSGYTDNVSPIIACFSFAGGDYSGQDKNRYINPETFCYQYEGDTSSGYFANASPELICFSFAGGDYSGQDENRYTNPETFCYQYEGDISSGYFANASPELICFSFAGGDYSGQDENRYTNPETFCYQYEGDISSGYFANASPELICFSFAGGDYSGQDENRYTNPETFCYQYEGDISSGYFANVSPEIACFSFVGGDYSGQDENRYTNPHSCVQFMASSSGGSGHNYTMGECLELIPLPIESSPLFGEVIDNKGYLHWKTFSERDNDGFEIEKSYDGYNWEVIGWIDGQGNTTATINYGFYDDNLTIEGQYYRFKQYDYDGIYAYSNIVFLNYENKENLKDMFVLYPNPSRKGEVIKLRSWASQDIDATILIADGAGRVIHNEKFVFSSGMETFYFPVDKLSPGTYHLSLRSIKHPEGVRIPFVIF